MDVKWILWMNLELCSFIIKNSEAQRNEAFLPLHVANINQRNNVTVTSVMCCPAFLVMLQMFIATGSLKTCSRENDVLTLVQLYKDEDEAAESG